MDLTELREALWSSMEKWDHDDGSLAPLLIRFSWHMSGTYCKHSKNGGSNGCTYRFDKEADDPENNGLAKAAAHLENIKHRFPWISYADLYVLAGTVAIEYAGGPRISFATGRKDFTDGEAKEIFGSSRCPYGDGKFNPSKSRLPAADLGPDPDVPKNAPPHIREAPTINAIRQTFNRMGFDDRETVCLILLGHQFGRCHPELSGYEHAWYVFGPAEWNAYLNGLGWISVYSGLISNYREVTSGPKRQWNMKFAGSTWMMLPSDMCLYWDDVYRSHVEYYNSNRAIFREDAARTWKKLIELGCDGLLEEEIPPTKQFSH